MIAFAPAAKWLVHTNETRHFTINYPAEWTRKTANQAVVFLRPREGDDSFKENVNLMLQDLSANPMTLQEYTDLSKKQVTDNLGAGAILSLKNIKLAGQQAREFVFNMTYKDRNLKVKQYWFIKDNTAYLLTYTADPDEFDKYDDTATEIMKSFKFY